MVRLRLHRAIVAILGLALVLVLAAACAKAEKAAAPAPAAPAQAPAATPAPTAAPAPAAPTAAQAPAPTVTTAPAAAPVATLKDEPFVPGGPVFYASEIAKYPGWQILQRWHHTKLALWTKAKYGGNDTRVASDSQIYFGYRMLSVLQLNRPFLAGMLLYTDFGRCSMVGRDEDFSVCNGQYARNNGFVIVPGIFQRWEQPDPVTHIFHVRKGVLWPATPPMARADREVTAEDIVFFLEATKKDGITRQNFVAVKRFEATDRYTVKITLDSPVADFLLNLVHTSQGIFPRECYEEKDCLTTVKSVSPGPFLIKEYEPRVRAVFEKNPEFYLKGLPYLDRFTTFHVTDPNAQKAGFITGQFSSWNAGNLAETEDMLKRVPGSQVQAIGGSGATNGAIRPQYQGPLADLRVRRALTMSIDFLPMWQVSMDGFGLLHTLVSRHYFGDDFYPTFEQMGENYQFNPAKAKRLMAEAGYQDGFTTSFLTTPFPGIWYNQALFMQAEWKKHLGVDMKFQLVDGVTVTTQYLAGSWQGFLNAQCCWIPSCWGMADDAFAQFVKGSPQNVQKINDPVIEELYVKQRRELDPAKRVKLLWEFHQYEASQVYQVRVGLCSWLQFMAPWEMNGAAHGTMYWSNINGPTWLAMHDPDKYPPGRK